MYMCCSFYFLFILQKLDQWTIRNAFLHLEIIINQHPPNSVSCGNSGQIMETTSHTHAPATPHHTHSCVFSVVTLLLMCVGGGV